MEVVSFIDSSTIISQTFGNESGPLLGIDIEMADSVEFTNGASIGTATSGQGAGSDILITANQVSMDGFIRQHRYLWRWQSG